MAVMYTENILSLFQTIWANPSLLERAAVEKADFLQRQGNLLAQGTGNKVTNQEACFAVELEKKGFTFLAKNAPNPASGLYYRYQVNGSQQEGDFGLYAFEEAKVIRQNIIDLKHTNSKKFYFNDGWFQDGVIYAISWNAGTAKYPNLKTHIGMGQDVPSDEEKQEMTRMIAFKKEINGSNKKVGSLCPYIRFANQYSCEKFSDETSKAHFDSVQKFISEPMPV